MQLVVLGMHRSGSSMLTRLINLMGAYFGSEDASLGFDDANPKGYWERKDVLWANEAILQWHGCTWDCVADWNFEQTRDLPAEVLHRMRSIILGMDGFRPWVMKDPRMCLTLPCWRPLLEVPVAVLLHRDPLEIANSLKRRGTPLAYSLSLWEYYAIGALNATRDLPRVFVRHDRLIAQPVETVARLLSDLEMLGMGVRGLSMPSEQEIKAFVDPRLNRARANGDMCVQQLTPWHEEIVAMLSGERAQERVLSVSPASVEAIAEVKAAVAEPEEAEQVQPLKTTLIARITGLLSTKSS